MDILEMHSLPTPLCRSNLLAQNAAKSSLLFRILRAKKEKHLLPIPLRRSRNVCAVVMRDVMHVLGLLHERSNQLLIQTY